MNTPRSLALAAIAAAATTVMSVLPPGTHASPPAVVVAATFDGGRSSAGVLGAVVTTPDDAPVEVTVSCGAMACPDDSSITWWVDGTQVQADVDGVVRLRPSWAGVHHVAVRVAGEVYGRARLQILAAPRSVDVTTSVAPDPRQDRHVLWAAAAAGLLPPCGRGPADGLRLCPEPAAADVSVDTPDGRAYDPLHCGTAGRSATGATSSSRAWNRAACRATTRLGRSRRCCTDRRRPGARPRRRSDCSSTSPGAATR